MRAPYEIETLSEWLPTFDAARADEILDGVSPLAWLAEGATVEGIHRLGSRLVGANALNIEGGSFEVALGLTTEGHLACACPCRSAAPPSPEAPRKGSKPEPEPKKDEGSLLRGLTIGQPCRHEAALLAALVADSELRREIAGLPELAGTAQIRAAAAEEGVEPEDENDASSEGGLLAATLPAWQRRGRLDPLGGVGFLLEIDPGTLHDPDLPPGLRVQIVEEGTRRPVTADLIETRRITGSEWRLLEPLLPDRGLRGGFVVRGDGAARFLERAAHIGAELLLGKERHPLRCDAVAWRPALRVRPATRSDLAGHPVLLEEAATRAERREGLERVAARLRRDGFDAPLSLVARSLGSAGDDLGQQSNKPMILEAVWRRSGRLGVAPGQIHEDDAWAERKFATTMVFLGGSRWILAPDGGLVAPIAEDVGPVALSRLQLQPTLLFEQEDATRLPGLLHEIFTGEGVVLPGREELGLAPKPQPRIRLRLTGDLFEVAAQLEAVYGRELHAIDRGFIGDPLDESRDADAEEAAVRCLEASGMERLPTVRTRRPRRGREVVEEGPTRRALGDAAVEFWTQTLPGMVSEAEAGGPIHEILIPRGLSQVRVAQPVRSSMRAGVGEQSVLDLKLWFDSDGLEVEIAAIRRALAERRQWIRLSDGSVARLSERVAEAAVLASEDGPAPGLHFAGALGVVGHLATLVDRSEIDEKLSHWLERLGRTRRDPTPPGLPRGLKAELRPYQREGVAWLGLLAELGVGGVLADGMGLGKTLQMLTAIAWRCERDGPAPSLVVAPTSVASIWVREAERFLPDLRVLLLHGADRHVRYEAVGEHDLVVTTYALLRRDVARLKDFQFRYVVLDEAQNVKNHAALTTVAARSLRCESHIALTGTPIENRLLELWSLVEFAVPGLLGSARAFARRFEAAELTDAVPAQSELRPAEGGSLPVVGRGERSASSERSFEREVRFDALRARIRPFVLRRTKGQVERDLPARIETDVVVEMTPAQRRAYAALAATLREDLETRTGTERVVVLTALLRLRQMACDPRLLDSSSLPEDSAKLLAFRELVDELRASGRRALVFSQFVEVLSLVRRDLEERGVAYSYLDGSTRDRETVVKGFVESDVPLFLLSLRAGGTGLNLAAADTVIHLDPWWNPAVEDQATDRAHRIGQTRTVSVYRLITAGTVEESMRQLIAAKRSLAREVLGGLGEGPSLRADELETLLRDALAAPVVDQPVVSALSRNTAPSGGNSTVID